MASKKRKIQAAFARNAYIKKRKKKLNRSNIKMSMQTLQQQETESSSGSADEIMGKGKRKRFQNVRMLPIEDLVKSPGSKKK